MKISYRKMEVANFHGVAKNMTTPEYRADGVALSKHVIYP
jgi:hypothetical protein